MFIAKTPIMVADDAGNRLLIRPDLTLAQYDMFFAAYDRLARSSDGIISPKREEILIFMYRLCGWDGPAFGDMPFSFEAINLLDYDDPLVERGIVAAVGAHWSIPDVEDPAPKAGASAIPPTTAELAAGSASSSNQRPDMWQATTTLR